MVETRESPMATFDCLEGCSSWCGRNWSVGPVLRGGLGEVLQRQLAVVELGLGEVGAGYGEYAEWSARAEVCGKERR